MQTDDTVGATSRTKQVSMPFQTGGVLLISLCHFVHDVYSSFLSPLLPLLIEKLSLSLTRAGLLSTVMQLPALLNPMIGVWADRIRVRWFIIVAPSLTAVPMCLIGLAPNYGVLLLLLFVAGISVSLFHVPAPVMVARLSAGRKGRGMSFFMVGGVLTAGPLSDRFGRRQVLLFSLIGAPLMLLGFIGLGGWLRFGALILTGFTLLSTTPVMLAMVQEQSAAGSAAANGMFMMASFTARSSVVVVVGFIADLIGLQATYLCSALLGMAGIPFILMLPKYK